MANILRSEVVDKYPRLPPPCAPPRARKQSEKGAGERVSISGGGISSLNDDSILQTRIVINSTAQLSFISWSIELSCRPDNCTVEAIVLVQVN